MLPSGRAGLASLEQFPVLPAWGDLALPSTRKRSGKQVWTRGALSLVLKISSSCDPKGRALPAAEVPVRMSVAQSCALFATPQTVASQASLSMGFFSDKNTGAGCHFPPPRDLPNPGIEPEFPVSPALQADSLPTEPSAKPHPQQKRPSKTFLVAL